MTTNTNIAAPSVEQIQELIRHAVQEVFKAMAAIEFTCENPSEFPTDTNGQIVGAVGFIGEQSGVICLCAGQNFARVLTRKVIGLEEGDLVNDEMLNDTMGELSNMVVGYVKSRLCDRGLTCIITIPSIVRGQKLSVESNSDVSRKILGFRNGQHLLAVELLVKN